MLNGIITFRFSWTKIIHEKVVMKDGIKKGMNKRRKISFFLNKSVHSNNVANDKPIKVESKAVITPMNRVLRKIVPTLDLKKFPTKLVKIVN